MKFKRSLKASSNKAALLQISFIKGTGVNNYNKDPENYFYLLLINLFFFSMNNIFTF